MTDEERQFLVGMLERKAEDMYWSPASRDEVVELHTTNLLSRLKAAGENKW